MISEEELRTIFENLSPREVIEPAFDNWVPCESSGYTIINLNNGAVTGIGIKQNEIPNIEMNYVEIYKIEAGEKLFDEDDLFDSKEYENYLNFKSDDPNEYTPDLISEFCKINNIDEKERKIKLLADKLEEYKFMNYQGWENSIIQNYHNEGDEFSTNY